MQAAQDFLEWGRDVKGWTPDTIETYKSHLLSLTTFLTARIGHVPEPCDITVEAIERHDVVIARAGKAQRSRQSIQACFISFCRYLRKHNKIDAEHMATVAGMDRVRVTEKPRRKYATGEHVRLMFAACGRIAVGHGPRLAYREPLAYALLGVLAYTGARASEVCAIRVADLDMSADIPLITLHGKGNKDRTLPLHSIALGHLRHWLKVRPSASADLFELPIFRLAQPVDWRRLSPVKLRGVLAELKELAGIVDEAVLKPHAFRRFAAAALASVPGCKLSHVKEFLGHSSLIVTEKYLGSMPTDLKALVEQMNPIAVETKPADTQVRSVRREMKNRRIPR